MIRSNNGFVGINTRCFLVSCVNSGVLNNETLFCINRALDFNRERSPSGTIYDLSIILGASKIDALNAGSLCELWYACCSLTDDIQDGDGYYVDDDVSIQVNTQAQLICLSFQFMNRYFKEMVGDFSSSGCLMLSKQYFDLKRGGNWDEVIYKDVANGISGVAFGNYMKVATVAANLDHREREKFVRFGIKFGEMLQLCVDYKQRDERLLNLNVDSLLDWGFKLNNELGGIMKDIGLERVKPVAEILKRLSNEVFQLGWVDQRE